MKKLLTVIGITGLLVMSSRAQDTNKSSSISQGFKALEDAFNSTNWGYAAYGTLGNNTDKHGHRAYGGGILGIYNLNQFMGIGGGIDGLTGLDSKGQATIVSANIQGQIPFHPLSGFSTNSFAQSFTLTPYLYSGMGTSFGATINQTVIVHEAEGINVDVYGFGTWQIGVGFALCQRQNAGVYSGGYKDIVLAIHHPF